jgi:hypothetical protein
MLGISSGLAFDHPCAVLAFQHVLHIHASAWRAISLGLEMDLRGGFILTITYRRDTHVHVEKAGAFRKIIEYALPHGFVVLNILRAAGEQNESQAGSRNATGANHISMISETDWFTRVACGTLAM